MSKIKELHNAKNKAFDALQSIMGMDDEKLITKLYDVFCILNNRYEQEYKRLEENEGFSEIDIFYLIHK